MAEILMGLKNKVLLWSHLNEETESLHLNHTNVAAMITTPAMEADNETYTGDDSGLRAQAIAAIVVPIIFGLIFVVGIFGNGTLIFTILKNQSLRNGPNIMIVSLAAGDFLLIAISVPFLATSYTFPYWPYGNFMCKLTEYLRIVSLGISVFTLITLSADRYIAIVSPVKIHKASNYRKTLIMVASTWILSLVLGIVTAVSFGTVTEDGVEGSALEHCYPYAQGWPDWYPKFDVLFKFLVYFTLPVLIIAYFYISMAISLFHSADRMPVEECMDTRNTSHYRKQIEGRKKVAKVVLSFVVIFILCWLPRHAYLIWFHVDENGNMNLFWYVFKIVGFCLAFINSCVNPLTLYILSKQFRRHYNRSVFCCRRCKRQIPKNGQKSQSSLGYQLTTADGNGTGALVRRSSTSLTALQHT
ncbi:neuropeptide CCHamide-1 receptor [Lingula anatina]|uniref:Neuropeptide CCHamide-1 receptor n=1 Tax=Lingula anatina TaxID=7574 RepID=A0A1S3JCV4_LINAN|nr:neuropeptide CCHamide-1 receptor [Lingula anatina]|eukprot:XP_013408153.1 neuropeptide CCHamide-1 receptor [Lingula anatina]